MQYGIGKISSKASALYFKIPNSKFLWKSYELVKLWDVQLENFHGYLGIVGHKVISM
jgi:hypothetical protein